MSNKFGKIVFDFTLRYKIEYCNDYDCYYYYIVTQHSVFLGAVQL